MYDRNRLTPVSLSGEYPVTELIIYLTVSNALLLQKIFHLFLGFCDLQAIQKLGIDHLTGCHIRKCSFINIYRAFLSFDYLDHRQSKFLSKLPVTGIVRRYCHNSTCTIRHQHIIRDPYRNLLAIHRIDR